MRVYKDRDSYKDFDWGHEHKNSDNTKFPKGVVHVQRYPGAVSYTHLTLPTICSV